MVGRCPACKRLAVETVAFHKDWLFLCHYSECPGEFFARPNGDDGMMRSIAWVFSGQPELGFAANVGLDARPYGDHGGLCGRTVAIVHRNGDGAEFNAVFEARGAYDAGAFEVRIVASAGFDDDMPGRLFLEWLGSPIFPAVVAEGTVAL